MCAGGMWVYVLPAAAAPADWDPFLTEPRSDSASSYCDGRMMEPSSESQSSYSLSRNSSTVKFAFSREIMRTLCCLGGEADATSWGDDDNDRIAGGLTEKADECTEEVGEEERGDSSVWLV